VTLEQKQASKAVRHRPSHGLLRRAGADCRSFPAHRCRAVGADGGLHPNRLQGAARPPGASALLDAAGDGTHHALCGPCSGLNGPGFAGRLAISTQRAKNAACGRFPALQGQVLQLGNGAKKEQNSFGLHFSLLLLHEGKFYLRKILTTGKKDWNRIPAVGLPKNCFAAERRK